MTIILKPKIVKEVRSGLPVKACHSVLVWLTFFWKFVQKDLLQKLRLVPSGMIYRRRKLQCATSNKDQEVRDLPERLVGFAGAATTISRNL